MSYGKGYKPRASYKLIYNTDPSKERGYIFDGDEAKVPPLGSDDNPQEWPAHVVDHILRHDRGSEAGVRGWLTDKKEEYDKAVECFKVHGYSRNIMDDHVISNPKHGGVFILSAEDNKKLKDKAQADLIKAMLEDEPEPEKKPGRPKIRVKVNAEAAQG